MQQRQQGHDEESGRRVGHHRILPAFDQRRETHIQPPHRDSGGDQDKRSQPGGDEKIAERRVILLDAPLERLQRQSQPQPEKAPAEKRTVQSSGRGSYIKGNSVNITEARDIFLYRTVSRVAKPKESSGGGSSTDSDGFGGSSGGSF